MTRRGLPLQFQEFRNNLTKEKYPLTFPPQMGGNRREGKANNSILDTEYIID